MKKPKKCSLIQPFLVIVIIVVIYFTFMSINLNSKTNDISNAVLLNSTITESRSQTNDFNVWLIFTKVSNRSSLTLKFSNLVHNLLKISSVPLRFHIIVDEKSKEIAKFKLSEVVYKLNKSLVYTFYNVQDCASRIRDIVNVMTPFFSSKPGTYYSDALFYISLGLYRVAPISQRRAILLDCDLYFKKDIALLFDEFQRFKPSALFGLAPELTPVYHHILHIYKRKHKTTFGDFYHENPISPNDVHPRGFQGYNSGVVLIDFEKQRSSKIFPKVISRQNILNMTGKYKFRGHLGDQDFFTLLGYEYPDLIQTLNCGFNRQLCTWWKDHGYQDVFDYFFQCNHPTVVLHGNCNTRIPNDIP